MLQLVSKNVSLNVQRVLRDLQKKIDSQPKFADKTAKAQSQWNSKGSTLEKKQAFDEITKALIDMCVYVNACNYCEHNESNDIEHIAPKSFFPENTFVWSNYLRACKQCNSGYKLDKCYVLDNNDDVVEVKRTTQPMYQTIAFINPRIEDPNQFMLLDLYSYEFQLLPDLSKRDTHKAEKTLEILQLNNRALLLGARKNAAIYYYQRLDLLTKLLSTHSIADMEHLLTPHDDLIDKTLTVDQPKDSYKRSFKKDISTYQHPSVWYTIKTIESKTNAKWQAIFGQIPEALDW